MISKRTTVARNFVALIQCQFKSNLIEKKKKKIVEKKGVIFAVQNNSGDRGESLDPKKEVMAEQLIIPLSCRTTGQYVCARYHLCRHVSGLLPQGCVGKEAACDTCNRLHFVPGHTLLSGFTLSCTRNDLTFPTSCRSIYFGHLGFQGAVDVFVTGELSFQVQQPGQLLLDNVSWYI